MSTIPEQMRRVVVSSGSIDLTTADVPTPTDSEALVQTVLSGVCGSDTHAAHGRHPFIPLPYNPGHEVVGVVRGVGSAVTDVSVGDRVTVMPTLFCGACKMCTTDRPNLCENLRFFGCGYDQGGMADYFTVHSSRLVKIPDDLSDRQAALIEPLGTPVHATKLAGDLHGKAVAILGSGTIGLLVLAAARHRGAARIVMTDMLPSKRERALRLGADAVIDAGAVDVVEQVRTALGESADVVFDCVAIQHTVSAAVQMALKAGTVVIVGVPASEVTVPLPVMQDQQVRLQGSATYVDEDYADAIAILQAGEVRAEDFITSEFPMEQAADAFATSSGGEQVKVIVTA